MKTLYFNQTYGAFSLCSYISRQRPNAYRFRTLPVDHRELLEGLEDPESVFCLSIGSLGDVRLAEAFFLEVSKTGLTPTGRPKFLVGGSFFSYADCRAFLRCFPETSYIVIGKGESALLHALECESPGEDRILRAEDFGAPDDFLLGPALPWHPERPIAVGRGDFICRWGKCRFCHHTPDRDSKQINIEEFCSRLVHYYRQFGWRLFYITENHLESHELRFILEKLESEKVRPLLDIFGMRMVRQALDLSKSLTRARIVRDVGWGLEMYSQRILNLYRKGILVEDMLPILSGFAEAGVTSHVHILLGLPGCSDEDYEMTYEFLHENMVKSRIINRAIVHWFVLSPPLMGRIAEIGVKLRTRGSYCLSDYFGNIDELPDIKTAFQIFDTWDQASRRWIAHDEVLLGHADVIKRILSLPGAYYDFRGFFVSMETWRELWGDALANWLNDHPALIARPQLQGEDVGGGLAGLARKWMKYGCRHKAT